MGTKRGTPSSKAPEVKHWQPSRVKRSKYSLVDAVDRLQRRSVRDRQRGITPPDDAYLAQGLTLAGCLLRAAEGMGATVPSVLVASKLLTAAIFVELDGVVTQGEAEANRLVSSAERITQFGNELETVVRHWPYPRSKKSRSQLGVQ